MTIINTCTIHKIIHIIIHIHCSSIVGEVIEPLELTEEVQSYLKRTGGKRDRKKGGKQIKSS